MKVLMLLPCIETQKLDEVLLDQGNKWQVQTESFKPSGSLAYCLGPNGVIIIKSASRQKKQSIGMRIKCRGCGHSNLKCPAHGQWCDF